MKTTTLDEVKKLATPGKLMLDGDRMVSMADQADILRDDAGTEREWQAIGLADADGFAEVVALAHPDNAALLVHSMNIRDELIEALEKACALARASDDEYEAIDGIEQTKALEAVLMRAKTVEMP